MCKFLVRYLPAGSSGRPTRHLHHQHPTWAAGASRNFRVPGLSPILRIEAMRNKLEWSTFLYSTRSRANISKSARYESFICKSSFLHSSRAIKKNVRLGRSLYNTLFRGIGNCVGHGWWHFPATTWSWLNECARTRWKVSNSFKIFLHMRYVY